MDNDFLYTAFPHMLIAYAGSDNKNSIRRSFLIHKNLSETF